MNMRDCLGLIKQLMKKSNLVKESLIKTLI